MLAHVQAFHSLPQKNTQQLLSVLCCSRYLSALDVIHVVCPTKDAPVVSLKSQSSTGQATSRSVWILN